MKLVFFLPSLEIGGAERQVFYLARGLRHHHDVHVLTLVGRGELWDRLQQVPGVSVESLGLETFRDPRGLLRLIRFLSGRDVDVFQTLMSPCNVLGILASRFVRISRVLTSIRTSVLIDRHWLQNVLFYLDRALSNRWSDRVVCNSYAGLEFLEEKGFDENRLLVVPNAVDLEYIRNRSEQPAPFTRDEDGFTVGYLGRMVPLKGVDVLLDALGGMTDRWNKKVYLAGPTTDETERNPENAIRERGLTDRVEYVGELSNPYPFIRQLDVLVSCSKRGEGMNNTIMEGMALKKPVVATDVGDAARLVADGESGYVVPPGDPDILREKLGSLYDSPDRRERMGREGYERIQSYSIDSVTEQYNRLIQNLLPQSP